MITAHQPTIFGDALSVYLSDASDGNMRRGDGSDPVTIRNYETFLRARGLDPRDTTYQLVTFEGDDYCRYKTLDEADKASGIDAPTYADAVVVGDTGHVAFLPLADCTGAVLFDPVHRVFMISHLGRHSTEQRGATRSVEFLREQFGSEPRDLLVWLSPSPNGEVYPLWKRDNRSFRDVNSEDLLSAGVLPAHLEVSPIDTVTDHRYFSHSEFLKGHRSDDGRYAIAAVLR